MSIKLPSLAICAALILGGCSIGKPIEQPTTYVIEPPPPATSNVPTRPDTLRMGDVSVAAAFSGSGLVYRLDDVRFVSDPYNAFIADPAAMIGSRMADWLDRAGPFKAVVQPGSTQSAKSAPYVLEAVVTELYGDTRKGMAPAAVMTVQFAVVNTASARMATVYQRTVSRRVEIVQTAPDALVRGYGTALSEILSEVRGDLAALPVAQAAGQGGG
jgi:cholesterol transport system auxiliary component